MTAHRTSAYSEKIDAALRLAAAAHYQDMRKGTEIPYAMHPFHVALILDRHGFGEEVVIAGLLHDVLEDPRFETRVVQDRLRSVFPALGPAMPGDPRFIDRVVGFIANAFGSRVLELVVHVTEKKADASGERRPWRTRKEEQLAAMAGADADVCALKAADCLHNLRSVAREVREHGTDTLVRFRGGPDGSRWYYSGIVDRVVPTLGPDHPLSRELAQALAEFVSLLS